jgi:uncharacterized membrane protein
MKTENVLGKLGLGMAIGGAVWGFLILLATGMSNVTDEAKRATLSALPIPIIGFILSVAAIIVTSRRGNFRTCARVTLWGLVISVGMILLTLATWNSYR